MANGTDSHETPDVRTVDVEQLMAAMSGLTQRQIEDVLQGLLAARAPLPRLFGATPPLSRRRPRRPDVVTYRVRIDLKGTRPPLWRRLSSAPHSKPASPRISVLQTRMRIRRWPNSQRDCY